MLISNQALQIHVSSYRYTQVTCQVTNIIKAMLVTAHKAVPWWWDVP
jgi:hypothetical protein